MKTIFEIINGNFILRKEYRDKVKDYLDGNMPTTESDKRFAAQSYLYGVLRSHGVANPMSLAAMVVDSIVMFNKMNEKC